MTHRLRRVAAVLVVAAALLAVPGVAWAAYVSQVSAKAQVSTATMVAPANLAGSWSCSPSGLRGNLTVDLTGFVDGGPAGARYSYRLLQGSSQKDEAESASRAVRLTGRGDFLSSTTWTLEVTTVLGGWSSPTTTSRTLTCTWFGSGSGSL